MPKTVHLSMGMFDPPDRLAALAVMASHDELVLTGAHHLMIGGRLAVLRGALTPRRMVALLVDDELSSIERDLVDDLLNDGVIPVIVAAGDAYAVRAMSWLEDAEPSVAGPGRRQDHRCLESRASRLRRWRRSLPGDGGDARRPAA